LRQAEEAPGFLEHVGEIAEPKAFADDVEEVLDGVVELLLGDHEGVVADLVDGAMVRRPVLRLELRLGGSRLDLGIWIDVHGLAAGPALDAPTPLEGGELGAGTLVGEPPEVPRVAGLHVLVGLGHGILD